MSGPQGPTDAGRSSEMQALLISVCHNSGFGFKSGALPHQSPGSAAQLALGFKDPLSVCLSVEVFNPCVI
ncbi:Hypothetical protein SMAX5B_017731 [Scophthalmus maximus]|uniref:Uncharacterized protein n=1 Tax=Scophthalmus maximus TaxID=52904 RepID=A0A2U9CEX3_SCOMX|nr:Hypothetical protein SMAX5B_017731 [Scophthalmus maximus]